MHKEIFCQEHPITLTTMMDLPSVYLHLGQWKKAEELDLHVVKANEMVLGNQHLETIKSKANLAAVFSHQGKQRSNSVS
jgi:hypothetical protein